MQEARNEILEMLPEKIREEVLSAAALYDGQLHEIRLYCGGRACVVCRGQMLRLTEVCSEKDLFAVLMKLCGNSLYAHSDSIREGYIFTAGGVRVGVCGRAVVPDGKIERVTDITSLCIRLPLSVPGAADDLLPYIFRGGGVMGMLIWSPPGVGKTTLLREITRVMSVSDPPIGAAVVDTRHEITAGLPLEGVDVLLGYPRAAGMEIAVRTMAPRAVICDEIAGSADAEAILRCAAAGVAVIATAHAGCREDLLRKTEIRMLLENGIFPTLVGLKREGVSVRHIPMSGLIKV